MAAVQQAHGGSADAYFQEGQQDTRYMQQPQYGHPQYAPPQQAPYGQQPQYAQPQYQPPPQSQQVPLQPYPQQPPMYNQQPQQPMNGQAGKMDFNQTFKVEKPGYNDIWAAILFLLTFAGFVAVSGIAIQGYSATKLFQGGSIYGGANTVGLSTNTIILL
jgi:hypothetical protein